MYVYPCVPPSGFTLVTGEFVNSTTPLYHLTYYDEDPVDHHSFAIEDCSHPNCTGLYTIDANGTVFASGVLRYLDGSCSVYTFVSFIRVWTPMLLQNPPTTL